MNINEKIEGTDDAWESEILGADKKHAIPIGMDETNRIDDSLNLQTISIRLNKEIVESFKILG